MELVDALASGASGLTAVKVRVLSWAPFSAKPLFLQNCGLSGSADRYTKPGTALMAYHMAHITRRPDSSSHVFRMRALADAPAAGAEQSRASQRGQGLGSSANLPMLRSPRATGSGRSSSRTPAAQESYWEQPSSPGKIPRGRIVNGVRPDQAEGTWGFEESGDGRTGGCIYLDRQAWK